MTIIEKLSKKIGENNKELLFKTALTFLVRSVGILLGFVLNILITRMLTIEQAGYYFIAFTIAQVLAATGQLGLPLSMLRFIGGSKSENNMLEASSIYRTGAQWVFVLSTALSILLWLSSTWLAENILNKPDLAFVIKAISPSVVLFALLNINSHALQALGDSIKSVTTLNIISQFLLASILLSGLAYTAEDTALFLSTAYLITVIVSLIWWLKKPGIHWLGVNKFSTSTLWQSCLPLWWMTIMNQIVQWGSQLIAGVYVSPEEYANFAVAQRIVFLVSFVLVTVNQVVAPRFAALYKQGNSSELERITLNSTKLIVIFSLPIIGFMLVWPQLLLGLFGEQYEEGALVLRILVIGHFVNILTGSVGCLLPMTGHERDLRNIVMVSGIITIIVSLILTPIYGVIGAALGTTIALASQKLLAVAIVNRRLGFNTLAIWKK